MDGQQIHVQVQMKVGICNVLAIADVDDVPYRAVKRWPDVSEQFRQGTQLALLIGGLGIGHIRHEQNAVL